MSALRMTSMAGKQFGRMGYGLMQLTWNPHPPAQEDAIKAMLAAAKAGATAWSTGTFYGPPTDPMANLKLIGKFFDKYPEYIDKIVLVVKGGLDEKLAPTTDIDYIRKDLEKVRQAIGGKKEIDVYSYGRLPQTEEVEDSMSRLSKLVKEGLFNAVGACEMKAATMERALKITPIAVLEIEVSLWSYEKEIQDAVKWCTANQVPILAYSPLGRGFLTRTFKSPEDVPQGSFQSQAPRFRSENFYKNLKLVDKLDEIAAKKGISTAQLALAWIIGLSDYTVPIPGSAKPHRIQENVDAANMSLTSEAYKEIQEILNSMPPSGGRYPETRSGALML